jgi:hypothetical protein
MRACTRPHSSIVSGTSRRAMDATWKQEANTVGKESKTVRLKRGKLWEGYRQKPR